MCTGEIYSYRLRGYAILSLACTEVAIAELYEGWPISGQILQRRVKLFKHRGDL